MIIAAACVATVLVIIVIIVMAVKKRKNPHTFDENEMLTEVHDLLLKEPSALSNDNIVNSSLI